MSRRIKNCLKSVNIFGIETLWFANVSEPRESIRPILELLNGAGFTYFTANTREELVFVFSKIKKAKPGILYLASHGNKDKFYFGHGSKDFLALNDFKEMLSGQLKRTGVHFSACNFMEDLDEKDAKEFLEVTGAEFISGYTKTVDWLESTCMDILFLNQLQNCVNDVSGMIDKFNNNYSQLVDKTGFVIYLREWKSI